MSIILRRHRQHLFNNFKSTLLSNRNIGELISIYRQMYGCQRIYSRNYRLFTLLSHLYIIVAFDCVWVCVCIADVTSHCHPIVHVLIHFYAVAVKQHLPIVADAKFVVYFIVQLTCLYDTFVSTSQLNPHRFDIAFIFIDILLYLVLDQFRPIINDHLSNWKCFQNNHFHLGWLVFIFSCYGHYQPSLGYIILYI